MGIWSSIKSRYKEYETERRANAATRQIAQRKAQAAARQERVKGEIEVAKERERYRTEQRKKYIRGGGFAGAVQRFGEQQSMYSRPRQTVRYVPKKTSRRTSRKKGSKVRVVYKTRYVRDNERRSPPSLGDLI